MRQNNLRRAKAQKRFSSFGPKELGDSLLQKVDLEYMSSDLPIQTDFIVVAPSTLEAALRHLPASSNSKTLFHRSKRLSSYDINNH
ncbi:hypothetical protein TNCV_2386831 [Trichonephila clavipes]|nr:hypothetical protein TNCV_2386831 [Trichonephila clavipes]